MKCESCYHYEVCKAHFNGLNEDYEKIDFVLADEKCKHYKDKDLMVELPCKVGDIVWYTGYGVYAIKCCVSALHISNCKEKNRLGIIDDYVVLRSPLYCARNGFMKKVKISEFGKTVFFTKEEAEKKLEELNNELN